MSDPRLFSSDGQERRAWLEGQAGQFENALRYYLGPQGYQAVENVVRLFNVLSPGADVQEASEAAGRMLEADGIVETAAEGAAMAGAMAALMMPGGAASLRQGFDDIVDAGVRAYDPNVVNALGGGGPRRAAQNAPATPPRVETPIRAYHGSPHDFDEFDLEVTPEGYLWFSDNRRYAGGLAGRTNLSNRDAGNVFEVNLHARNPLEIDVARMSLDELAEAGEDVSQMSPQDIETAWRGDRPFEWLVEQYEPEMRAGGHDAIAFRNTWDGFDEPTDQYVVFDERIIEIVRKYGIAAAAPMLGMTVAELQQRLQGMEQPEG